MSEPRPPRLAGRWLARVLPADVRDGILGDLEEVFRRDCRTLGVGPARRRYWRKTLSFTTRFTSEQFRPGKAMSFGLSWLDFKLGFRMHGRDPGLTLVGGLAIAFAIAVGASVIQFMTLLVHPTLPLDEGDRIVRVRMWDMDSRKAEERLSYDLASWRHDVRSIADLGAFRTLERTLIREDGAAFPVMVAEVSAAAFRVARVPPAMGRALVDADESSSAPMAVVIGHDVWRTKFDGDPGAIGRIVRIGTVNATVVGVMPKGFAFPINHDVWLPLRLSATQYGRRQGPGMTVFGRLAPGVTFEDAQTELSSLGARASADSPDTHEHLRPQVLPYSDLNSILGGLSSGEYFAFISANVLFVVGLVVLMCSNVALLMFARAATRESELIVRTALGASLGRVIMQLFTEALVLAAVGTGVGLAAATSVLQSAMSMIETEMLDGKRLPFWFHHGLMPTTIAAAAGLTLLCAVIAGVGPALKVMNGLDQRLRQKTAGGGPAHS